ncbi:hypothetical protein DFQ28_001046 [Apophysomyces sp. BC1034]|nr:hypothetical protein DFQ30_008884 [Apophysomyces sp. BC1015]KAG0181395.1 hypothetical protein DFQ29_008452 [Apophysomyces sp. BC1021]KAG0191051.1 hypothetical protein DFQ28_001046 [Apophysomyces sp. BC1034]
MVSSNYYLGIDVGTGSARAAVIDAQGTLVGLAVHRIRTANPLTDVYEQSTTDIWDSICRCVREAVAEANVAPTDIKGIGFDATCSLVVLDHEGSPLSVDPPSGYMDHDLNVILWADHRAVEQAKTINATQHDVLNYVGNTISPEMQIPKILWLKQNLPKPHWDAIGHLMDLPDFLTYRATGSLVRSTCSLTCKCSYLPRGVGQGWDPTYFKAIGLEELEEEQWRRLDATEQPLYAGDCVGQLCGQAAAELGLAQGTPVGSAVIDAYAGAIATLGAGAGAKSQEASPEAGVGDSVLKRRLAIICGTSSCHIAMSPDPIFVPGVWGPYRSVLLPDMWCAEGGQSSTGQLIDHTLTSHPAIGQARARAETDQLDIYAFLNQHLESLRKERGLNHVENLTHHMHIYPDYHGNRSPLADPTLRGSMVGLTLDKSVDDLAMRYLATIQAISCQTRHIIESLNARGYTIDTLCLSGGLCKNPIFVQLHANITRCQVILPECIDGAVVIGAAFVGARAAGAGTLWQVMTSLGRTGAVIDPNPDKELMALNEKRYQVFHELLQDQKKYRRMME